MTHSNRNLFPSRRAILKAAGAGCGLMTTHVSVMSTLLNLQATKAAVAASGASGYKAMVCLFLLGGNDSFNMLIPRNNASSPNPNEYTDYATVRGGYDDGSNNPGGLALQQSSLLAIDDPTNLPGRSFGLHPGFGHDARTAQNANGPIDVNNGLGGGIAKLYNDGKVAFISNIGSLIEPTSRTDYNNQIKLPLGLFSHADLQRHWMTGAPHTRSQITGWGGRISDLLQSTNQNPKVSMNISLSGVNIYQTGGSVIPYAIGTGGATTVSTYSNGGRQDRIFQRYTDSILSQTYSDLLAKSFAEANRNAIDAAIEFNSKVNSVTINTPFDIQDSLSSQFKKIAQVIGAASGLQQARQVFFVTIGGWDNHDSLLSNQDINFPRVSRALKSFYDATVELGCQDDVVTFTASDFSRTLGTNGKGSDHAWGANNIIMGGAVNGGNIFGDFPVSLKSPVDPQLGNLDLGRGRLIPTTSVDEMAAELAMWFGVDNATDLKTVLPNIESFYQFSPSQAPVGFLL